MSGLTGSKLVLLLGAFPLSIVMATEPLKQDNEHVRVWNRFAQDTLSLHQKLTAGEGISKKTRTGGYANLRNFYIEHAFYDGDRLISRVQWEKENPEQLHTIEVFVHDAQGKVLRDYMAAYLPHYHNAPTQTLISFHQYNGDLHAFRTFDASGYRIIERCSGHDHSGKHVEFILDEDEIADALRDKKGFMQSTDYRDCFKGLDITELGDYVVPK